jgi:hypothetical protein
MQSWTPVVVTDEKHARHGQAGTTVSGEKLASTPADNHAEQLRAIATQLATDADTANGNAIAASAAAAAARLAATDADAAATAAEQAAQAGGGGAQFAAIDVKFDADGQLETMPLDTLRSL